MSTNQIKSNQIKSNQIKSNLSYFSSNSLASVELTPSGDLNLNYDKGGLKTVKGTDTPPDLQKIKANMEKNGIKKLTKKELEQQLKKLEAERKDLEDQKNQN